MRVMRPEVVSIRTKLSRYETEQSRTKRIWLIRGIIDAAHRLHDQELQQMEALNSVKCDPQLEVPI